MNIKPHFPDSLTVNLPGGNEGMEIVKRNLPEIYLSPDFPLEKESQLLWKKNNYLTTLFSASILYFIF